MSTEKHRTYTWLYLAKMMPKLDPDTAEPLFNEKPFLKIGITHTALVDTRLNQFSTVYDAIKVADVMTPHFRVIEEWIISKYYAMYGYTPKVKFGGSTECYDMNFLPIALDIFKGARKRTLVKGINEGLAKLQTTEFERYDLVMEELDKYETTTIEYLQHKIKTMQQAIEPTNEPIDDLSKFLKESEKELEEAQSLKAP